MTKLRIQFDFSTREKRGERSWRKKAEINRDKSPEGSNELF